MRYLDDDPVEHPDDTDLALWFRLPARGLWCAHWPGLALHIAACEDCEGALMAHYDDATEQQPAIVAYERA